MFIRKEISKHNSMIVIGVEWKRADKLLPTYIKDKIHNRWTPIIPEMSGYKLGGRWQI